jgi:hypothetical protein
MSAVKFAALLGLGALCWGALFFALTRNVPWLCVDLLAMYPTVWLLAELEERQS